MACACRGRNRAGARTATGQLILGFKVTFPPTANRPAETYLTKLEAERARRIAGCGTITTLT